VKHRHIIFIALMLGAAAAAGLLAATRTVDMGRAASTPQLSDQAIAARAAKLDDLERSLQAALDRGPPKLPRVSATSSPSGSSGSAQGGVLYVRQPATVVSSPSSHESESEGFDESEPQSGDD
jgi:hypothetical protein